MFFEQYEIKLDKVMMSTGSMEQQNDNWKTIGVVQPQALNGT